MNDTDKSLIYYPCLRWKQGEYLALNSLSENVKDHIVPLIEVDEIGYDFESREASKTIDQHLSLFCKRVKQKWENRKCLVDLRYIDDNLRMDNGDNPIPFVFKEFQLSNVDGIPVIDIGSNDEKIAIFKEVTQRDQKGICIRLDFEELENHEFQTRIFEIINKLEIDISYCDLVIDLRYPNFEPIDEFAELLITLFANIPNFDRWRSLIIIGTSFPRTMAILNEGINILPRYEWVLYKKIKKLLLDLKRRVPNFGDYSINFPEILQMDMRLVKPNASIRYSIEDSWLVIKGKNVRDFKFDQYHDLCKSLVDSGYFFGGDFSLGDEYIFKCSKKATSTGNLSTWRQVGTNHHLNLVVQDLANLFSS